MNKTFDDLTLQEKIDAATEFFIKFSEAIKPIVEHAVKVFQKFSREIGFIVSESFSEDFKRQFMVEAKKERNRKRYYRMMERRKLR